MYLTRHQTADGARWALDNLFLPRAFDLGLLLQVPASSMDGLLSSLPRTEPAQGPLLAPVEAHQEVWACGVTYLRSREAREAESTVKDVYARVYEAVRPELFFKAVGWRVVGHQSPIRVREDSGWNVPEPELTLVVNAGGEIVGYCVGDDVSSRDIEGENPLYLPQAKVYNQCCGLGPWITLPVGMPAREATSIHLVIRRGGREEFRGKTGIDQMARSYENLIGWLGRDNSFPRGAFLLTGTGIVPDSSFTLQPNDEVEISIDGIGTLVNPIVQG